MFAETGELRALRSSKAFFSKAANSSGGTKCILRLPCKSQSLLSSACRCLPRASFDSCARSDVSSKAAPVLLVVNQGDKNLSLVDPASGQQIATIAEGVTAVHGHEVATSPDGRIAYVPIYGSAGVGKPGLDGHEMLVIDIPARKIIGRVDFGHGVRPHCAIYNRTDGLLYVTTELDKDVTIIDPHTLKIVGTIPTGQEQSHMLAISHDGAAGTPPTWDRARFRCWT